MQLYINSCRMKTVIQECGRCEHEYQDSQYGRNRRVMNVRREDKNGATCTVCGNQTKVKGVVVENKK